MDCNPKLVETLRSVTLVCFIVPDEGASVRRMKRFFMEAKSLTTLELAVGNEEGRYSDSSAESEDEDAQQEEDCSETGTSTAAEAVPLSNFNKGEAGPSNPPVPYQISAGPFDTGEGEGDQGNYYIDRSDGNANKDDSGAEDGDDNNNDSNPVEPTYTGLPNVLPNTLQYLLLSGPANSTMLKELDEWIVHARNRSWLLNLRTIAFRLVDPAKGKTADVVYLTEKEQGELEQKIEELLNILRQRSPTVEVIKPRPLAQLRYPLTF
ncbi:hypothetical protein EST38_g7948 [Candolleomyces aberdarensis]|uniref:Uncharacterized protein n=1 Tax=Candolleomyces aberdarensis TaxID=2316362 RepID=A0A4Q2DDW5_9AGAR|nr:hypothetical protein EST38_g7948 [Candolleomyces aberdarensis]